MSYGYRSSSRISMVPTAPVYTEPKLTHELVKKLKKKPRKFIAPFRFKGSNSLVPLSSFSHHGNEGQSSYVPVPLTFPEILRTPVSIANRRHNPDLEHVGNYFGNLVSSYNPKAREASNFGLLTHEDLVNHVLDTFPIIIDQALSLPNFLSQPLPILKQGENKTIYLTRQLCCSLLANAFLCIFPESNDFNSINFALLFNDTGTSLCHVKKEKIKSFLSYFQQMDPFMSTVNGNLQNQVISFERRSYYRKVKWEESNKKMCPVEVDVLRKVEDTVGLLQVLYSNQVVGGDVLGAGCSTKEMRFTASPELLLCNLLAKPLGQNEALVITGTRKFSEFMGSDISLKFCGEAALPGNEQETDNLGRTFTQVVCINSRKYEVGEKFEYFHLDQELQKCFLGFNHGSRINLPVATGYSEETGFDCDSQLKLLIQWIAASQQGRPFLKYMSMENVQLANDVCKLSTMFQKRQVTVGQLYKVVIKFHTKCRQNCSTFEYIKRKLCRWDGQFGKMVADYACVDKLSNLRI